MPLPRAFGGPWEKSGEDGPVIRRSLSIHENHRPRRTLLTPAIGEANAALPSDRQDASLSLARGQVNALLLDLGESRLRAMDAAGVDMAVLPVTTPATKCADQSRRPEKIAHGNAETLLRIR